MRESVRSLLTESIDYAGVFPPACLSLDRALENYVRYLGDPEAWLIARFACPAEQLPELDARARILETIKPQWRSTGQSPHRLTIVAAAANDTEQFRNNLHHDVSGILNFHKTHSGYARTDALELKLPADLDSSSSKLVAAFFNSIREALVSAEINPIKVFVELRPQETKKGVSAMLDAIKSTNDGQFCLKIRTGGLPLQNMPRPEQLAFFINACSKSGVCWKATAGLHAPLSSFDGTDHTWHFGFINVFAAAVFATAKGISDERTKAILTERSGTKFRFTDNSLSWGDLALTIPEIETGRAESILSFGSCSFEEPRDGLQELMAGE